MDVRVGLWRKLSAKELMLLNCGVGEYSWESLGLQGDATILKEISPGCSLEGMMLKLKLQYFGHLMRRVDSLEKTLMLGGIGGRRKRGRQRMRWLNGITNSMDVSLSELRLSWWWTGRPGMLQFMGLQRVGHDWATELNWTELKETRVKDFANDWKKSRKTGKRRVLVCFEPKEQRTQLKVKYVRCKEAKGWFGAPGYHWRPSSAKIPTLVIVLFFSFPEQPNL